MNNKYIVGQNATSFKVYAKNPPITQIILATEEGAEDAFYAGTEGYSLTVYCPWATQQMANDLLAKAQGFEYQGFEAGMAALPGEAERGDGVVVNGVYGMLADRTVYFNPGMNSDISAPYEEEVNHEFQYVSPIKQDYERKIGQTKASLTVGIDSIRSTVEGQGDQISSIEQTVDGITLTVTSSTSPDGQTTASIVLKVGPNSYTGYIKLDGNVDVSGQLSAEALYAALGDIADLTVDRLSTSRRIVKYLAGDQSDDNYVRIQDQYLEFVSGVYAGGTEQATNPNGGLIYWEADPSGATIGSDGYPYVDGERIFTTTNVTDWPVMIYTYNELVKRSIAFEQQGEQYVPVDVFGAGDAQGRQQGRLLKDTEGLLLGYQSQSGKDIGLHMGDDGYMDLYGLRKTTGLNFGEWDSGRFYERIDGDDTRYQYDVAFDAQGRPVKITDSDGHETIIDW